MKNFFFLSLFILTITSLNLSAQNNSKDTKVLAVKFHADWCKSCMVMGSSFTDLQVELKNNPVEFVKLDFTNKETQEEAKVKIAKLGLDQIIKQYVGTGFILLIEAGSLKVKGQLTKEQSFNQMKEKILTLL